MSLFSVFEDHLEKSQSLDELLIKNPPATYFFTAKSAAMAPYILENDILLIDRSLSAKHDQIILANFQGEIICRRIFFHNNGEVYLCTINKKYSAIKINKEEDDFTIWGVVRSIIRNENV